MMKTAYQKIGLALALFLMLVALLGVCTASYAQDSDSYELIVNYGTGCERVELTIGSGETQAMVSGQTYLVPKTNARITVRVILKNGYKVQDMSGLDGEYPLYDNARNWMLTSNDEITVTCEPKSYSIEYLSTADREGDYLLPTTGSFPKTYVFGNEDTRISTPVLGGYRFDCWLLLSSPTADESTGQRLSPKEGEESVLLSSSSLPNTDTETLYLKPKWTPIEYEVYRYDYVYNSLAQDGKGAPLFSQQDLPTCWKAPMGSEIDGSMGGDKVYPGFEYLGTPEYYSPKTVVTVSQDGQPLNIVYRLYLPLTYELELLPGYEGSIQFAEGVTKPEIHTFNVETLVPNPVRTGYVFMGWNVKVVKNGVETTFTKGTDLKIEDNDPAYAGDKSTKITMTAIWVADQYDIHIDLNRGAADDESIYSEKYVYDQGLTVQDPVRPGYTFKGWLINGDTEIKSGVLDPFTYSDDISMVAQWEVNKYHVTYDGNGATQAGLDQQEVTFDSPLDTEELKNRLPVREGHLFRGFTLTKDGNDLIIDQDGNFLGTVWSIPNDTTLYAKWEVLPYNLSVNLVNATVYFNDVLYTGTPVSFPYGTTVTIRIEADAGYKVTAWRGEKIAHQAIYTTTYVIPAQDSVLNATVLRMITAPAFRVDYINEIFVPNGAIADGRYQIKCEDETISIVVESGNLTVNGVRVSEIAIPESFFGKTAQVMMFGDGTTTADSDPLPLTLVARPPIPLQNAQIVGVEPNHNSIVITMNPDSYEYEFAISLSQDGQGLMWKTAAELTKDGVVAFRDLYPGTIYYVYIRVKACEEYPHGTANVYDKTTYYEDHLRNMISQIERLQDENDGEMAKQLVKEAIEAAKALKPSATYYNDLQGIYNRTADGLVFARQQDTRIAELESLRDALIATGEFNDANQLVIRDYCSTSILVIKAAQTPDEVNNAFHTGSNNMKSVLISKLVHGDMTLTTLLGLPQGSKLFHIRVDDISDIANSVDTAIKTGKITVALGNTTTYADVIEALKTLDVMAYYNMNLQSGNAGLLPDQNGMYEMRLLLPDDLRGVSGLQVAYYSAEKGLEVLATTREGDYLVFTAPTVTDFVILGDPTVNLVGFIVSLSVILACQLIGIVFLCIRRFKFAKEARSYSLILPTLLTIRLFPDNALTVVLILGGLVILFQIVLTYLLLSAEVFYRRKKHRAHSAQQVQPEPATALPVMAEQQDDADASEDLDEAPLDEEAAFAAAFAEDTLDSDEESDGQEEYEEDVVDAEEDSLEADGDDVEEVEEAEAEAVYEAYGDDDFIEPAANPRYSLPDEDFAELAPEDESLEDEVLEDEQTEGEEADAQTVWEYDEDGYAVASDESLEDELLEEEADDADAQDEESEAVEDAQADVDLAEQPEDEPLEEEVTDGENPEGEALDAEMTDGEVNVDDGEALEAEELLTEEDAENANDVEDEIYIEPDARGEAAPAPDYGVDSDDEDELKQYDGYEE